MGARHGRSDRVSGPGSLARMPERYWIETLGCPKNEVDSDKLVGTLTAQGMEAAAAPDAADLIVVNTCAFIESARQESIDTVLTLRERADDARLVVTGCMAERYGDELAEALPEADAVAGFGVPVALTTKPASAGPRPKLDLLNLPRPASPRPWAYVKVAEGCDRNCGFCAIPSFRGPQRSRSHRSILEEVQRLDAAEIVLVAQDLASFGRDQGRGERTIVDLIGEIAGLVERVRLLYLYPSDLDDRLVDAIIDTGVPYFDLSLQHVSRPLLRSMRRWGDGDRFLDRIESIRSRRPDAAFRSNFIVGYPGETEQDHDRLLDFIEAVQLDWCGFFAYSAEAGTHAAGLDGVVPPTLVSERLRELGELQDAITAARRDALIGERVRVLVDAPGIGRTHREAPEIDGVVLIDENLSVGSLHDVDIRGAVGPDLVAVGAGP